jgi:rfaE bifunctional protein nucleotidyltransferase chain/domain
MRNKIFERNELKKHLDYHREKKKKIVFTNGCFDLIHTGHVCYLSSARQLGDLLVVGLNTDRSVSAIKPGRPIISQEQRAVVLSALEMVDYVTFFDEDTPRELIKTLRPDVLVKGADWAFENIAGREFVKEVQRIPLVGGISTSKIIDKIITSYHTNLRR